MRKDFASAQQYLLLVGTVPSALVGHMATWSAKKLSALLLRASLLVALARKSQISKHCGAHKTLSAHY